MSMRFLSLNLLRNGAADEFGKLGQTDLMKRLFLLTLVLGILVPQISRSDDWPQWRGINRDAKSNEKGLLSQWPEGGPPVLWEVKTVGVGYSSVSVADGKIYTMGDLKGVEHVIALDEKTGKTLWTVQPDPVAQKLNREVEDKFSRFDVDSDGKLTEVEALNGLGSRALDSDSPGQGDPDEIANQRVARLFEAYDKNGDGSLDPKEIPGRLGGKAVDMDSQGARTQFNSIARDRAEMTMKLFDTNGDGQLVYDEVRNYGFQRYFNQADRNDGGNKDKIVSLDELTNAVKREKGKDGVLTKEEVTTFYRKNYPGEDGILSKEDFKSSIGGYRNGMGDGPRGTPFIDGDMIYTEGGNGDVTCLAAASGSTIWHRNLVDDFGGKRPGWGYSESPLVVDDVVFVTPGGSRGTLLALNKADGTSVWQSSGTTQGAHYSSPIVAEIAGREQIVQFGRTSTFGVTRDKGELLWEYSNAAQWHSQLLHSDRRRRLCTCGKCVWNRWRCGEDYFRWR